MADYLSQTKIWRWGIFDSNYCSLMKRKRANGLKHQALQLSTTTKRYH